ncbi:hypothetical protein C4579_00110 [Candidatus Microgenomates bacterium]|nr:MAG: hypothetical protein C4579_00110 [Candidatus Microgenomates bacterium]
MVDFLSIMSPRKIEVYVPDDHVEAFKVSVGAIPGAYVMQDRKVASPNALQEYLERYQGSITLLDTTYGEEIERKRRSAYANLASGITGIPVDTEDLSEDKYFALRRLVNGAFLEPCFSEPSRTFPEPSRTQWGHDVIRPQEAEILVRLFGLLDGEAQNVPDISKAIGMHQTNVHVNIQAGMSVLSRKLKSITYEIIMSQSD